MAMSSLVLGYDMEEGSVFAFNATELGLGGSPARPL